MTVQGRRLVRRVEMLRTIQVSLQATLGPLAQIPADRLVIIELDAVHPGDVAALRDADINAFLVGVIQP